MTRQRPILVLLAAACIPAFSPPAKAQQGSGLGGFFRSVTGALGGPKADTPPAQQQNVTATLGTRGIEEGGQKAAGPSSEDYSLMEGWSATRGEAESSARTRGLESRQATLKHADGGTREERK